MLTNRSRSSAWLLFLMRAMKYPARTITTNPPKEAPTMMGIKSCFHVNGAEVVCKGGHVKVVLCLVGVLVWVVLSLWSGGQVKEVLLLPLGVVVDVVDVVVVLSPCNVGKLNLVVASVSGAVDVVDDDNDDGGGVELIATSSWIRWGLSFKILNKSRAGFSWHWPWMTRRPKKKIDKDILRPLILSIIAQME